MGTNVSPGVEPQVLPAHLGQFRDPQTGLDRQEQERVVAAAQRGVSLGSVEEGFDLVATEVLDERALGAFVGEREYALDGGRVCRLLEGEVAEERVDGGQASVAGADRVAAVLLEVGEESDHEIGVEVRERERRGCFPQFACDELEEQPEAVSVRCDGVGAGAALMQQALGEESFEQRSEQRHETSPPARSSLRRAIAISSGEAVRYQYVDSGAAWPR